LKILLVIDHFGPGGAQRQIVELACGLKQHGHELEMFVYFPQHDFFRPRIEEQQIVVHEYSKVGRFSFGVVSSLASLFRKGSFDVIVSFLKSANVYTELAGLISGGATIVVSERTSHHDDKSRIAAFATRMLHVFSDHIVSNSMTHCAWLQGKWWLRKKVTCIYNGLDLDAFYPARSVPQALQELQLLGIGRIGPEKNILNLIKALELFHDEFGYVPQVRWAGRRDDSLAGRAYCRQVDELLESLPGIRSHWHWLGVQTEILELLQQHDGLIHPSSYEGLPNVVCEALAAGLPVLVSDVCDHPLLVADEERGFLFDADEPASIAGAIGKLHELNLHGRRRLSRNARDYAKANLGSERMVTAYEALFMRLLSTAADTRRGRAL
jgi:glycosyltransferase involved in cell wall biosynthesis